MTCTRVSIPCTFDFSKGHGTGTAEAIGNWGFSNRVCNAGGELQRLKCVFAAIDHLRNIEPKLCVKYNPKNDPETWYVKPSPEKCKPSWTFPECRPLITYSSTSTIMKVENMLKTDLNIPGRTYVQQGSFEWYRRGPDCCPQPSCLAPQCSVSCRELIC